MGDKNNTKFYIKGIIIAAEYFVKLGNEVCIYLPPVRQFRNCKHRYPTADYDEIKNLEAMEKVNLNWTPSNRKSDDKSKNITYYDDEFMIYCALDENGVILTNDKFTDIKDTLKKKLQENPKNKEVIDVIESSCLSYMFQKTRASKPPKFQPAHMPWNNKDNAERSLTLDEFLTLEKTAEERNKLQ